MKYLFTLIFALSTVVVYGQIELPKKDGKIYLEKVIQSVRDSASKELLYKRAKRWFVTTYKSANDAILFDDPEGGEIIGNCNYKLEGLRKAYVIYTITIGVKNGKYRCIMTDLVYTNEEGATFPFEEFPKLYDEVHLHLKTNLLSLIKAMTPIAVGKKDDWEW